MKNDFSSLMSHFSAPKGFTLVEMVIVVGLVGALATVLLIGLNPLDQLQKSSDADRKADLSQLQRALELYYQDNGAYPPSSADFKISANNATLAWGTPWQPYMSALPKDPNPTRSYQYYAPPSSNGQSYYLYASLERGGKDPQACNKGDACQSLAAGIAGFPPVSSCGGICNYGLTSPNVSP